MRRLAIVMLLALAACTNHGGAANDGGSGADGGPAALATSLDGSAILAFGDAGAASVASARAAESSPYISSEAARATAVTVVQAMSGVPMATAADCDAVVRGLDVSFGIAGSKAEVVGKNPLIGFGQCTRGAHEWRLLREVGYALQDIDPGTKDLGFLASAESGYGHLLAADADFADLLRKWPKDPHVYRAAAAVACRLENWTTCQKRVDQALGFARNRKAAADDPTVLDVRILKAIALLHTNKLDDASREVDAVAKASDAYAPWKARFDEAKATKVWIEPELDDDIYPALIAPNVQLYGVGKPLGPLATITLWNISGHALDVKVSLEVEGLTDPASQVVHFTAQKSTVKLTPVLRAAASGEDAHQGTISIKVSDATGYRGILERSIPTTIHGVHELPTTLATGPRASEDTSWKDIRELAAVRVSPTDPQMLLWIDAAKTRAGAKVTWDPTADPSAQVQALWDELNARKITFTRDATSDNDRGLPIAVRDPGDVLTTGTGTTLEGAVLFASALEALGLSPAIVDLPGHAMVGWLAPAGAPRSVGSPLGNASFLATSALGHQPYEAAVLRADADVLSAAADGAFDQQRAFLFLLSKLRKAGFTPLGT